jgi:hypothetical protein
MSGFAWLVDGLIAKVKLDLDVEALRKATYDVIAQHPLIHESTRQLSLQHRKGSENPWYESCLEGGEVRPVDTDYATLNPGLENTYFAEVFSSFPFPVFRARLMALAPRYCYSVHQDQTARLHLAIDTSEHAPFIFVERNEVFRIPADGNGYWVDTREVHTAMNGGSEERLHLVVGLDHKK